MGGLLPPLAQVQQSSTKAPFNWILSCASPVLFRPLMATVDRFQNVATESTNTIESTMTAACVPQSKWHVQYVPSGVARPSEPNDHVTSYNLSSRR